MQEFVFTAHGLPPGEPVQLTVLTTPEYEALIAEAEQARSARKAAAHCLWCQSGRMVELSEKYLIQDGVALFLVESGCDRCGVQVANDSEIEIREDLTAHVPITKGNQEEG